MPLLSLPSGETNGPEAENEEKSRLRHLENGEGESRSDRSVSNSGATEGEVKTLAATGYAAVQVDGCPEEPQEIEENDDEEAEDGEGQHALYKNDVRGRELRTMLYVRDRKSSFDESALTKDRFLYGWKTVDLE